MEYEVRIKKNVNDGKYDVDLVSWSKNGSGMVNGRAFGVSKKEAFAEAERQAELYNAEINVQKGIVK